MNALILFCAALVLLVGLCYWEIKISECAHLGPWAVARFYNRISSRYEEIKGYQLNLEDDYLGKPLTVALAGMKSPRILDVAAGTGRLAQSMLRQLAFNGIIINVDLANGMIREGQELTESRIVSWAQCLADRLPFPDDTFDIVSCLEALELFPDARSAIAECVRVLRPGGWLILTNRTSTRASFLIIGKIFTQTAFMRLLAHFPLENVRVERWQLDHDLALGRKIIK